MKPRRKRNRKQEIPLNGTYKKVKEKVGKNMDFQNMIV
jgi:hypothetical protein